MGKNEKIKPISSRIGNKKAVYNSERFNFLLSIWLSEKVYLRPELNRQVRFLKSTSVKSIILQVNISRPIK